MIKFGIIQALRRLPAEFADCPQTEVCEARGFLLASRPGAESVVWMTGEVQSKRASCRWIPVSQAG